MAIFDFLKPKQKVQKREDSSQQTVIVRTVGKQNYSAVYDPNEALKSSVVYRGIAILSDAVASTPISIYHKNKNGHFVEDEKSSLWAILNYIPNKRQNIYEFLENIVIDLVVYGNSYIYIKRNADLDISELVLLYPKTVSYDELSDRYTVSDFYNNISGTFNSDKIIHIRHKSLGTFLGRSIFDFAGRTIGLANATDSEALRTLQTGGRMKGILSSESSLTGFGSAIDNQVDTIRDNMIQEIESGKDIITLQSGAEFKAISQTVRDLQLVDLHQITMSDLARYFGVSLAKLGINQGGNYIASLQDSMNFYTDSLNPLLKKIEAAFNSKLISPTVIKKYKIEFDRTSLTYFKEILSNYEKMVQLGLLSINDVRMIFNKDAADGGDSVFVSTNQQPLTAPKVDPLLQPEEEPASINTMKDNKEDTNGDS